MYNYSIDERVRMVAEYIVKNKATVRQAGRAYGISKSTVHSDMTTRLNHIDVGLFNEVRDVLEFNLSQRHIRGGVATHNKYLQNSK